MKAALAGSTQEFLKWLRDHGGRPMADRLAGSLRLYNVNGRAVLVQIYDDGGFEVWRPANGAKVDDVIKETREYLWPKTRTTP